MLLHYFFKYISFQEVPSNQPFSAVTQEIFQKTAVNWQDDTEVRTYLRIINRL